jgi:hypothetical protein
MSTRVAPLPLPLPPVDNTLAALIEASAFSFNFVVSCARSKDCPIVYASDGFYELTGCAPRRSGREKGECAWKNAAVFPFGGHAGRALRCVRCVRGWPAAAERVRDVWARRYTPEETIGRNCRFLQGRGTERNKARAR